MKSIDFAELEYEFSLKPYQDDELGKRIITFNGFIEAWDDQQAIEKRIGDINGYRIDFREIQNNEPGPVEILEQISPEIADFSEFFLAAWGVNNKPCAGVIYVNEINISPDYRSLGLGSNLLNRIPQMMDVQDCLITLKAFPITYDYGKVSNPEAVRRVKKFYEKLGFEHVGGEYMALNTSK